MPASSSRDVRDALSAQRFVLLRPLGSRGVPVWAALECSAHERRRLVVVERVASGEDEKAVADLLRAARQLVPLDHPNLARVRGAVFQGEELLVVSDFVDGARWSELILHKAPPLEIALRVLTEVLEGLSALHDLGAADHVPLIHGELGPDCILVGVDGIARVARACRLRSANHSRSTSLARLAPELFVGGGVPDIRVDVYGAGVFLWEALTGHALFGAMSDSEVMASHCSGREPLAAARARAPWSQPLIEVAARALAVDPEKRFASAERFAAEVLRVAAPHLASTADVAELVRTACGDAIRSRREALERRDSLPTPSHPAATSAVVATGSTGGPTGSSVSIPPPFPKAPRLPSGLGTSPVVRGAEDAACGRSPLVVLVSDPPVTKAWAARPGVLVAALLVCSIGLAWVVGLVVKMSPNLAEPRSKAESPADALACAPAAEPADGLLSWVPGRSPKLASSPRARFTPAASTSSTGTPNAVGPSGSGAGQKHEPSGT